ncbi:hypothetical protein GCM10027053_30810 [Intrasporangium mesophilum]
MARRVAGRRGRPRLTHPNDQTRHQYTIALIAALSALLGAGVGGLTSYAVATRQIEAQHEAATAQFLRERRQEAYTQFVEAGNDGQLRIVVEGDTYDSLTSKSNAYIALVDRIRAAQVAVVLYGSDEAVSRSFAFIHAYQNRITALLDVQQAMLDERRERATASDTRDLDKSIAAMNEAATRFESIARVDFGIYR